ncbi:MAG TPA: tetratricopeptide repeat protein, partial [Polyangiales bacterium]|nr:tetratricopeptide repeat protein [Polyangiales bacterium]
AAAPEPAAAAKPEPQPAAAPEPVAAAKPEPQPAAAPEPVAAAKPEPQPAAAPEPEVAAAPEPKLVAKAERAPAPEPQPMAAEEREEAEDDAEEQPRGRAAKPSPQLQRAQRLVDAGMALSKDGRLGLAEQSYLKALHLLPNYPRALAGLARVHILRKDGAEAVRWAKRLVARKPNRGFSQLLLGDAQALRGDDKAARRAWTQAARYGSPAARARLRKS